MDVRGGVVVTGAAETRPAPALREDHVQVEAGMLRVCCGKLLPPRMGEVRDAVSGRTELVTVWRCPRCGRVRLR